MLIRLLQNSRIIHFGQVLAIVEKQQVERFYRRHYWRPRRRYYRRYYRRRYW